MNDLIDEAGKDFLKIKETLRPGGTDIQQLSAWWAPLRWPTLFRGSTTTSPTIAEAGALYTEAGECVKPLLDLWLYYERGHGPHTDVEPVDIPIARAARADLEWGIALHERGDTPARVVARLERHAALAQKALETDMELADLDDRDPDLARRRRLANATLEEVDDVLGLVDPGPQADVLVPQPDAARGRGLGVQDHQRSDREGPSTVPCGDLGRCWREGSDPADYRAESAEDSAVVVVAPPVPKPSRSWDPTVVLAAPTGPPPRSPARVALDTGWAQGLAIGLGGLAAVLVGMQDALDPNAAWGTLGDFLKVVAACRRISVAYRTSSETAGGVSDLDLSHHYFPGCVELSNLERKFMPVDDDDESDEGLKWVTGGLAVAAGALTFAGLTGSVVGRLTRIHPWPFGIGVACLILSTVAGVVGLLVGTKRAERILAGTLGLLSLYDRNARTRCIPCRRDWPSRASHGHARAYEGRRRRIHRSSIVARCGTATN